ncbi:MAG: regulator [Bacteroidetes bacterium]|nr:MAG: regulator [Bacteroidota bacterium]
MIKSLQKHIGKGFKSVCILLLFVTCLVKSVAGNYGSFVKAYTKADYNAARQNWSVCSAPNGSVYFANHQGLLSFDGTTWQLHKLPNESVLRAVKSGNDSVIYTSGYMELGYWKPDKYGKLHYFSLTEKAEAHFTKNMEFWNIAINSDFVYFHSFSRILMYHSDTIVPVELPPFISVMTSVNNKILAAVRNTGIYEINGKKATPYIVGDFFNDKMVQFIIPFKNESVLIGTASHGIFIWNGNDIQPWNKEWTDYFISNELNRGFSAGNGQVIAGTIIDGIIVFDEYGELIAKLNTQNGLPNNTVLDIKTDEWQNLWLALDDGIVFIPGKVQKSYMVQNIPGIGAIYSAAVLNNNLFLGTNMGLFVKPVEKANSGFNLVPGTQGQVWDCQIIENRLWVGHNSGTFIAGNSKAVQISAQSGGFSIKADPLNPGFLIQSTYNDLVVYKKTGSGFNMNHRINGFYDLIRYIELDHLGNIWASHLHRGVYKIRTDDSRENVKEVIRLGEKEFGKNQAVNVFKVENRIVFANGEKFFTYDDLNDTVVEHTMLNQNIGKFASSHRVVKAPNHHYWFITKNGIGLFSVLQDSVKLVKDFPALLFKNPPLVDGFENIFPTSEKTALLCMQNGLATLDATKNEEENSIVNFSPVLRQFELFSDGGTVIPQAIDNKPLKVKSNYHNIFLRFSFPQLSSLPVSYQYQLKGLSTVWSEPVSQPEFRFERLPAGIYTFRVKAVDSWGNESREFSYSFEILPAWYVSSLAILVYLILLILILLLFRRWGIRMTKRKEKEQHEKREQELIRLRNEKLSNEVEHKSRELASSTMAIIKKNEFLMELKAIIEKHKAELGSRYPDKYYNYLNRKIDENISNQDDWQVFETNFERAHDQFFTKIKSNYPDLTPGDLRLCAYLRMNLSSKEIAPLLGISVRGVENHRYRLRKKMNLEHDESLVNMINGA